MEGISHEAARSPARWPRQADRALRRQRHLDRRRDDGLVHRRHAAALRGLRLARDRDVDGHDVAAVDAAMRAARAVDDRPSLICCKTVIGKGAPTKAGTADAHGAALGDKEVAATRAALGWTPRAVRDSRARCTRRSTRMPRGRWCKATGNALLRRLPGRGIRTWPRSSSAQSPASLPEGFERVAATKLIRTQAEMPRAMLTRKASKAGDRGVARVLPEMIGGSAGSSRARVFTNWSGAARR
jgi:transketolase